MARLNSNIQVIAAILVMVSAASAAKREIPVTSGRTVRQQVESLAEMMEKEILLSKSPKDKFRLIGRVEDQITSVRENNAPQSAHDEAHMDLLVSVIRAIPEKKEFNKKDCAKYEADILNQFEPTAEETPSESGILPGWAALQALCK